METNAQEPPTNEEKPLEDGQTENRRLLKVAIYVAYGILFLIGLFFLLLLAAVRPRF